MSRAAEAARELDLRRQLYGRPRTEVDVVREIGDATGALSVTTKGWQTFLPRPAAIESAQHVVVGLQRLLSELAILQQGGGSDAGT